MFFYSGIWPSYLAALLSLGAAGAVGATIIMREAHFHSEHSALLGLEPRIFRSILSHADNLIILSSQLSLSPISEFSSTIEFLPSFTSSSGQKHPATHIVTQGTSSSLTFSHVVSHAVPQDLNILLPGHSSGAKRNQYQ